MDSQVPFGTGTGTQVSVNIVKPKKRGKKIIAVFLVVTVILGTYVIFFSKSDEEKIIDRLDDFASAFNEGDFNSMLKCLDKRSQSAVKGLLGISSAIIKQDDNFFSGLLKENDNFLSDAFGLSVGATEAELTIEVLNINFLSSEKAEVEANLVYTDNYLSKNTEVEKTKFKMVKENLDWYIVEDINLY